MYVSWHCGVQIVDQLPSLWMGGGGACQFVPLQCSSQGLLYLENPNLQAIQGQLQHRIGWRGKDMPWVNEMMF